jgi:hypothetical protein
VSAYVGSLKNLKDLKDLKDTYKSPVSNRTLEIDTVQGYLVLNKTDTPRILH